jgi:hypothetical protein
MAVPKGNFTIKKYNILNSAYSVKLYVAFFMDFKLLFRQSRLFFCVYFVPFGVEKVLRSWFAQTRLT